MQWVASVGQLLFAVCCKTAMYVVCFVHLGCLQHVIGCRVMTVVFCAIWYVLFSCIAGGGGGRVGDYCMSGLVEGGATAACYGGCGIEPWCVMLQLVSCGVCSGC